MKMKYYTFKGIVRSLLLAFIILLLQNSCKKDEFVPVDYCPSCTSLIELNNVSWPSKPSFAEYVISSSLDTTFDLDVLETEPQLKYVVGYLLISDIPYHILEYKNDSLMQNDLHKHIHFIPWDYDTPFQSYLFDIDGMNMISVNSLDKESGAFELSLDLTFHSIGTIPPNSPYPEVAHFTGTVQGIITPQ